MSKLKVLELFGGIGACSKALERLGVDYEIADYVEIDKYAVKSFNAMHNTNFEPQDICEWNKDIEVDLIMHGSPCQDFSLAGLNKGGDKDSGTRSSLMYETIRIVDKLKPKYVIWENVKNLLSKKHRHNFDAYLETMNQLGYINYYQVLNAKDYGIPQNRERVFTISIKNDLYQGFMFPPKQELKLKLKDMLEDEVDEKYYLSDKMIKYISATGTANFKNPDCKINLDVARPLTTEQNKRAGTTNYLSVDLPDNYDLKRPERVLKYLVETQQIKELPCCCDSTINEPKVRDVSNCITSRYDAGIQNQKQIGLCVVEPSIKIRNNTKKSYLEAFEGDGVDISSRMQYHRGNVQKESIQTITTSGGNDRGVVLNDLRIRKLTPKECWRLMGFDDTDYERAAQVNSNTQLYKQAGNSIVVNVLEAILKNLLFDNK